MKTGKDIISDLVTKAKECKDVETFINEHIKPFDEYIPLYRNPIMEVWHQIIVIPLANAALKKDIMLRCNPIELEKELDDKLKNKYTTKQLSGMSVEHKARIILGNDWTEQYKKNIIFEGSPKAIIEKFYNRARKLM